MRQSQYTRVLSLIKTLYEAQTVGLYADCQEGAMQIGHCIEENAGEETRTVADLEAYCELLYTVSIGETEPDTLLTQLKKVEDTFRDEFVPKIEMAFISYNASMADSMESIYLAANADENCDAYFIPVPCYGRNADGSLANMKYERSNRDYDGIETTSYLSYNLDTHHPDIIFTNNPYDNGNRVTCVHPNYFTNELKKHTEMLCYVPYFLPLETDGTRLAQIISSKSFDFVAAVSESDRQIYLSAGTQAEVVALGSAKIDKLFQQMQVTSDIPGTWQNSIPNIRQKKNLALVSSLGDFLKQSELYLDRLEEYVSTVERRHDIALIFRPHPLMAATIDSMCGPAIRARYDSLLERIDNGTFGMVDHEASFYPLIHHADLFAGELYSTLARMYALTGKPILETSVHRPDHSSALRGGYLRYNYLETQAFSLKTFLDMFVSGEILPYDAEQAEYARSMYANCDGTAGRQIYEYVKAKALHTGGHHE